MDILDVRIPRYFQKKHIADMEHVICMGYFSYFLTQMEFEIFKSSMNRNIPLLEANWSLRQDINIIVIDVSKNTI